MISSDFERAHADTRDVIPWFANGRLPEAESRQVEAHLAQCAECRADLEVEYRVLAAVRRRSPVEYAPQGSLQKLWSRIEDVERELPPRFLQDLPARVSAPPVGMGATWRLAAGLLVGVGLGVAGTEAWRLTRTDAATPYHTATTAQPTVGRPAQIHAVFAPAVTIEELSAIVHGNGLAIVNGPSEAGVYGLTASAESGIPASVAIGRLRADPRVRFAEPVDASTTVVP